MAETSWRVQLWRIVPSAGAADDDDLGEREEEGSSLGSTGKAR